MANTKHLKVKELNLDLANFRTVHQSDEEHAVNALISIHPSYFWGLMESLLDDGYHPTENIIVLKNGGILTVKEGNRRIASLKIIHGLIGNIDLPDNIRTRIAALPSAWKTENESVPCAIYAITETAFVDKLIARTHAKGETSGRDQWTAVAKARFARDQNKRSEPGLDLLEAYLKAGKNLNVQQSERWSGDYPITILDEAIQKLAPLLDYNAIATLVSDYPSKHKKKLDAILFDIGTSSLGFKELRIASTFWGTPYGVQPPVTGDGQTGGAEPASTSATVTSQDTGGPKSNVGANLGKGSCRAHASNDPKSVGKKLREFIVRGTGRDKIATLINEIKTLRIEDHPHAFCFLLRSIFELSAKAYCLEHNRSGGPNAKKKDGTEKFLVDILREIVQHLTGNGGDKAKVKLLHGPLTELAKKDGVLSVTSLNQLIHNPSFSIAPSDICIMFGNIFPLLEAMNG